MGFIELSKEAIFTAGTYGGSDLDWSDYSTKDTNHYSNKGGHKQRSMFFSDQHRKHFQKSFNNNCLDD